VNRADQWSVVLRGGVVVPVVRTTSTRLAERAVEWLRVAGFTTFEVTLTVPGALGLIAQLRREDGLVVGAGTVLDASQADACLEAGAQFIVSPVLAEALVPVCASARVPVVLSGLTPTEVHRAWKLGAAAVKVFPAGSMGGPSYVRTLRSVLDGVPLFPTGGVDLDNLGDYLAAGAACVGIGSDLISDDRVRGADPAAWIERARAYLAAGRAHRPDAADRAAPPRP
jgi:2-dehydro-3-deoxyphosphogluconate aldolase / (4S)-4-hydroxy-2-oxoglutarate aldolase